MPYLTIWIRWVPSWRRNWQIMLGELYWQSLWSSYFRGFLTKLSINRLCCSGGSDRGWFSWRMVHLQYCLDFCSVDYMCMVDCRHTFLTDWQPSWHSMTAYSIFDHSASQIDLTDRWYCHQLSPTTSHRPSMTSPSFLSWTDYWL